jgi:phenylalanyl-tRNA synthetase beta chain
MGRAEPLSWSSRERLVDMFDLKGELQAFMEKIFLDKIKFICYRTTNTLTDDSIGIEINNTYAGYIGKVKGEILERFDIEQDVFVCELSVEVLSVGVDSERRFVPLPKFPPVERDLAFIIDAWHTADDLIEAIKSASGGLLESVRIFDVFRGGNIPEGKKSCAFSLTFRSKERTLMEGEITGLIEKIVSRMTERFQAQLRSN